MDILSENSADANTAAALSYAAEVFGTGAFSEAAEALPYASEVLGTKAFSEAAAALSHAADVLPAAAEKIRQYGELF